MKVLEEWRWRRIVFACAPHKSKEIRHATITPRHRSDRANVYSLLSWKHEPKMRRLRRVFSEKMARELFRCGVRIFHFPNQKQKIDVY